MKSIASIAITLIAILIVANPAAARARISVFMGGGCCGGGSYLIPYAYPYPPYYPPRMIYEVPPSIVYTEPSVTYVAPPIESPIPAIQSSPTFIDNNGRACREYDTMAIIGGISQNVHGVACLQPDGSWRVVE